MAVRWFHALRFAVNLINLSTFVGLLAALAGRAKLSWGPRGLIIASEYGLKVPPAAAFTVGNVITTKRTRERFVADERLVLHEERHSWQWTACIGLPMLPLYFIACGWSWLRTRDFASRNVFERLAGLADGGYPEAMPRPLLAGLRKNGQARSRTSKPAD
jgi:hypothetical protein